MAFSYYQCAVAFVIRLLTFHRRIFPCLLLKTYITTDFLPMNFIAETVSLPP